MSVHRYRAGDLAGGAGGNPRRHQGGNSGVTGIVRSRRRAGDGFDRARPQHALCRGDQRRSGQARGQGSAGSRPVPRPGRASVRPGLVGPDQPGFSTRSLAVRAQAKATAMAACKLEIARLWSAIDRSVERNQRRPGGRRAKRPDVTAIPSAFIMGVA
jgi:hypothetical protein